ncbi:hypothetical protein OIP63_02170 [Kitasatospora purpeofusca]|nr:hypothetical protein OIP63_02170 [Kitasatospora purpeofusca]
MVKILVILRRTVDVGTRRRRQHGRHHGQNVDRVRVACQLWMTIDMMITLAAAARVASKYAESVDGFRVAVVAGATAGCGDERGRSCRGRVIVRTSPPQVAQSAGFGAELIRPPTQEHDRTVAGDELRVAAELPVLPHHEVTLHLLHGVHAGHPGEQTRKSTLL